MANIAFMHLPVQPLRITSRFGPRNTGIPGASTDHKGIDLGRNFDLKETPILAVAAGVVSDSYWNDYRGWVVILNHGHFKTLYQHLAGKGLSKGAIVKAGQQIGIMGNSSDPTKLSVTMHLHMELHVNGIPVDPEPYLMNLAETSKEEEMEVRYDKIEDLPKALQRETQELIDSGALAGNGANSLDVTEDMVRTMIIAKRYAELLMKENTGK